jgi:hypothetical protein
MKMAHLYNGGQGQENGFGAMAGYVVFVITGVWGRYPFLTSDLTSEVSTSITFVL